MSLTALYQDQLNLNQPLIIHLQLTTDCNLNCDDCYYCDQTGSLDINRLKKEIRRWKQVKTVALGGGEPAVYPYLQQAIQQLQKQGIKVKVTTNGHILKDISVSRVHISCDRMHNSFQNLDKIEKAIRHYQKKCDQVGLNHIYYNDQDLAKIEQLVESYNLGLTLLRKKPKGPFPDQIDPSYWVDACEKPEQCRQGEVSMYINANFEASICSIIDKTIPYTNLEDTWRQVKNLICTH